MRPTSYSVMVPRRGQDGGVAQLGTVSTHPECTEVNLIIYTLSSRTNPLGDPRPWERSDLGDGRFEVVEDGMVFAS